MWIQRMASIRLFSVIFDDRQMIVLYCKWTVTVASEVFWWEAWRRVVNPNSKLLHYSSRDKGTKQCGEIHGNWWACRSCHEWPYAEVWSNDVLVETRLSSSVLNLLLLTVTHVSQLMILHLCLTSYVHSQNDRFLYAEPMTVESTTQAICDLALRFSEGDEVSVVLHGHIWDLLAIGSGSDQKSW